MREISQFGWFSSKAVLIQPFDPNHKVSLLLEKKNKLYKNHKILQFDIVRDFG